MHPPVAVGSVRIAVRLLGGLPDLLPPLNAGRRLTHAPGVVAAPRDLQDPAEQPQRIAVPLCFDPGVPHRDSLAKYAAAFFRISFSRRNWASSRRAALSSSARGTACPFGRQVPRLSERFDPAAGPVTDAQLLGGLVVGGAALDDELGGLESELLGVPFRSCALVCHTDFLSRLWQPSVASSPRTTIRRAGQKKPKEQEEVLTVPFPFFAFFRFFRLYPSLLHLLGYSVSLSRSGRWRASVMASLRIWNLAAPKLTMAPCSRNARNGGSRASGRRDRRSQPWRP